MTNIFVFYLVYSLILISALAGRNWLSGKARTSLLSGLVLASYSATVVVGVFITVFLHHSLLINSGVLIPDGWPGLAVVLAPLIWASILALSFNRFVGR